jgi:hypothetical protein
LEPPASKANINDHLCPANGVLRSIGTAHERIKHAVSMAGFQAAGAPANNQIIQLLLLLLLLICTVDAAAPVTVTAAAVLPWHR